MVMPSIYCVRELDASLYQEPEGHKIFPRVCGEVSSSCDESTTVFDMPDVGFRSAILSMQDQQEMSVDWTNKTLPPTPVKFVFMCNLALPNYS